MKRSDGGLFTLTCWCLLLLFGWPVSLHAQTFVNRTYEAGLEAVWQGHGIGGADYDSDGDLDIYIASRLKHDPFNPRSWNRLYRNNGDGTFTDVALQAGVRVDFLPDLPSKI
ncbi:MAG: VCBS repeat-containing protein, partial [Bacteroidetes bacterium]|nr:VCBS repeat-containing protein [Bacteroidota bacterium]